ncbi:MAG: GNAT family N-acetyltransferase [Beijerinckiaceae bacterium]|nr:GNAT family N-acetyltransferase [Beijerinckiaceae bacterium]
MAAIGVDTQNYAEVREAVSAGLTRYNDRFLPTNRDRHPLALSVRDGNGVIVGGLIGELRMDYLHVELLWIDESQRGQGTGKRLIELAEAEARRFGATHMHLSTWSFQAPDFYKAMGFVEFGRMKDHPAGFDSIFLVKAFT